jgi:WD40 repeat protein
MDAPKGAVMQLELDAAGERLASSGRAHAGAIYDVATGRYMLRAGRFARLLAGGELAVTADTDGTLILWHARTGARLLTADIGAGALSALAVLGRTAVAPVQPLGATRAWDFSSALPAPLEPRTGARILAIAGDDRLLAVGLDRALHVYTRGRGESRAVVEPLLDARFTAGGEIVTLDRRGELSRDRRVHRGGGVDVLGALSSDGERALIIGTQTRVLDTRSFAVLAELPIASAPYAGALSPRGDVAVLATNGQLELWRVEPPSKLATLATIGEGGGKVAFSPDGTRIAAATGGGVIGLYDTATGRSVSTLGPHVSKEISALSFDASSSRLVTADADGAALVWDARAGALLAALAGHGDRIVAVAFDPAGLRIATASLDETVRLWVAATGAAMSVLPHGAPVYALAFSADGAWLATATGDAVRVWPPHSPSKN